jgi:hypothetical protein
MNLAGASYGLIPERTLVFECEFSRGMIFRHQHLLLLMKKFLCLISFSMKVSLLLCFSHQMDFADLVELVVRSSLLLLTLERSIEEEDGTAAKGVIIGPWH